MPLPPQCLNLSGVDVVAILRALHIPAVVIEKIENVPPSAGVLVVALLLYKVRNVH